MLVPFPFLPSSLIIGNPAIIIATYEITMYGFPWENHKGKHTLKPLYCRSARFRLLCCLKRMRESSCRPAKPSSRAKKLDDCNLGLPLSVKQKLFHVPSWKGGLHVHFSRFLPTAPLFTSIRVRPLAGFPRLGVASPENALARPRGWPGLQPAKTACGLLLRNLP